MNWGNRLLTVFIFFAGLMSYMVYRCVGTPVDLVTKEYYRDELSYQQIIDATQRANALSSRVTLRQESRTIRITFPPEMKDAGVSGNILFYCAANAGKDRVLPLSLDTEGTQSIQPGWLSPGKYVVKIEWKSNRESYYSQQDLTVL